MTRYVYLALVLVTLSLSAAPIDFKFDPDVRRPSDKETAVIDPFLTENAKREGVEVLPSGVQIERLREGYGRFPTIDDYVVIDYNGWLTNGQLFDSSYERGQPASFSVAGVVPGFSEGLQHIRMGGKAKVYIPSHLGYGKKGSGRAVPPNSTLVFEIEIHDVKQ